ncbi:unnamed protein product [Victoria cruziana]
MGKITVKVKQVGDRSGRKKSRRSKESPEFLPLEGGPASPLPKEDEELPVLNSRVVYIGRIPHGFYEDQMQGFFKQFGTIKRLRLARNRKTGKSRHYGFIEFESPQVAKIVADCMNNYLLFEHMLQVHTVPPEKVHPNMWKQAKRKYDPTRGRKLERMRHNKDRTAEEHKKRVAAVMKRDLKRRKKIKAAGIDYECPDMMGIVQPTAKKIKFSEEE